jgi:hypothetical protein
LTSDDDIRTKVSIAKLSGWAANVTDIVLQEGNDASDNVRSRRAFKPLIL